jgi:phage tail P2-like protein
MNLNEVSILNLLPPNLAEDKNVKMMAEAFDGVLRDIISKIPDVAFIPNLVLGNLVNETIIDLLAWQFHVDFYDPALPLHVKRNLVLKSLDWHTRKGTPSVVEEIVTTVFSDAKVEEWFEYGGLPYRFCITTEESLADQETYKKFLRAIKSAKNTRSLLDVINIIKQEYANAYCGAVIKGNGCIHVPAYENDANTILASMPVIKKTVNLLASENDANVFGVMVPEIKGDITILSSENESAACMAVVPLIKVSINIFAGEEI